MRALVQRVARASVAVADETTGEIGVGLVVLLGVSKDDDEADARYLVEKISNLRVFADDENQFDRTALDVGAEFLVVSQFTLYADTRRGRRPDFKRAAPPQRAEQLYDHTVQLLKDSGLSVATGRFQEYMQVRLQNDGPVTLLIDSADRQRPRRGPNSQLTG